MHDRLTIRISIEVRSVPGLNIHTYHQKSLVVLVNSFILQWTPFFSSHSLVFFLPFVSHKTYFQGNSLLNPVEGDGQPLFLLGARLLFSPAQIRRLGKGISFFYLVSTIPRSIDDSQKQDVSQKKKKTIIFTYLLVSLLRIKMLTGTKP